MPLIAGDVVKMRANMADVPYVFERASGSVWHFSLAYSTLASLLPLAQELLALAKQPARQRAPVLEVSSVDFKQRIEQQHVVHYGL